MKPTGAYLILDAVEGVLIKRGLIRAGAGLISKSNDKDIFGSFSVFFTPYFAESTYNFSGQKSMRPSFSKSDKCLPI